MTWRRAGHGDWPVAALWAASAAMALALAPWASVLATLLPRCALHTLTGVPCLACGATRAALALARGDLVAALAANPAAALGMLAVLAGLAAPAWVLLRAPLPVGYVAGNRARIAMALALAVNWAYLLARESA